MSFLAEANSSNEIEGSTNFNSSSSSAVAPNESSKSDAVAVDLTAAKLLYQQQVLAMRKAARDKMQKQEELRATLAASLEYTQDSSETAIGKVVFSLCKHPDQTAVPVFGARYVRAKGTATVYDIKAFVLHTSSRNLYRDVKLYIVSPVLAKVGTPAGGSFKQLLYPIRSDTITLEQLQTWCNQHSLSLNLMFKFLDALTLPPSHF